jgi:hypothetical protein
MNKKLIKMKNKQFLIIAIILFLQSCTENKTDEQLFDEFYNDAETKFLDCIDLGLNSYDQYFDLRDCDLFLKLEAEKRFNSNGINTDGKIWSASINTTSFDAPINCGYSKKYCGQPDKPIFDKTIYDVISTIDTAILLRNDTLHYQIDIRKTVIYFNCWNKFFYTNISIKIPKSIEMEQITDAFNRKKIETALNLLKKKYK